MRKLCETFVGTFLNELINKQLQRLELISTIFILKLSF
ncbi:hypothetical protein D1AOALGA4SA_1602 [Olavius algarvensis Delta 1 endosymbiont]|nr:hypothetical protein D1AOALGA4SA_1602 [Olavius algarvensis Delta 1 endosymbiont]